MVVVLMLFVLPELDTDKSNFLFPYHLQKKKEGGGI